MRLLLVEDDTRLADATKRGLEREGFAVDLATDGDEGFWFGTENAYDAIVLDAMLPKRSGFRLCEDLRSSGVWTPILMLTAKTDERDHANALDTGADDFLSKPCSLVVLVAHLHALIRRSSHVRPTVLTAGDLRLDPARHRCWRGDVEIVLTQRQFAVLEFLMSRAGEVVSKADILNHVWDFAFDGDPNIVEVYIGYLRRKIDAAFGRSSITTIRLVGYRLDPDG